MTFLSYDKSRTTGQPSGDRGGTQARATHRSEVRHIRDHRTIQFSRNQCHRAPGDTATPFSSVNTERPPVKICCRTDCSVTAENCQLPPCARYPRKSCPNESTTRYARSRLLCIRPNECLQHAA